MMDWAMWQIVTQTAWDWGGKLGVGGLVGGVIGWFLKRWFGSRDSAADRGRARVAEARPEVVPVGSGTVFRGDHSVTVGLQNRGTGAARDVRVTFTGSAAVARVAEIEASQRRETPRMNLNDSPFFQRKFSEPAELTVQFRNRFDHEYVVVLPVNQEDGGNHFGPLPAWGQHRMMEPELTKKQLREIGGA